MLIMFLGDQGKKASKMAKMQSNLPESAEKGLDI